MSVIDKIKLDGTTYDVGKTPDTTLAVSGSPADAAKVGTELDKKVDKVTGKGLSTEDFTTAEKTKLAEIAEGATNIVIDATLTQSGKAADAQAVGNKFTEVSITAGKAFPTDTASGAVATFTDGADDIPMKSVKVKIEPVQSGSGDPSPTNVRPISGWTGAQVSHSGADMTSPTVHSITLPTEAGTVYGGTLDVTNGVLTVDRVSKQDMWVNMSIAYTGDTHTCKSMQFDQQVLTGADSSIVNCLSTYSTSTTRQTDHYYIGSAGLFGYFTLPNGTGNDFTVQIVAKLATPITYHLTPTEIKSLLGDNNIWADAGDTTVTYRADTAKYIDKKIAEVVNALS